MSPSDFDNILRLLLSVGFCRKSESLVKFIDQYYDLFILYVSGRDSHFEMFSVTLSVNSGPKFEESYPNIWFLLFCRQIRTFLVTSREVILSRKSNLTCLIIYSTQWYKCCFSWLKENSQTLRKERTLQQPMVNNVNETIKLSECATLLLDIRFGEKRREFFFYS